jgi:malonate-semialdehyde dehydrogenase (acetylating)/methylmalonate-semialdehyde dehydrogenase
MTHVTAVRHYIDGTFVEPGSSETLDVLDPATGVVIARTPFATPAEVASAVAAAVESAPSWSETPVGERCNILFRFRELYSAASEELAELVTLENGKAISESRGEIRRALEVVDFAVGMPTLMSGATVHQVSRGVDTELVREPLGVVGGITPFNFPAMTPMWTIPIALAAGNTYVLKPSPRTPLSAMRLADLLAEAGVPAGVFNVVHGGKTAVEALIASKYVRAISFVGSGPVARDVYGRAAGAGKRVQALAGAKNHVVVMPDADVERAVGGIFASAFANAGQRCLATAVGVSVGGIADAVAEGLAAMARAARIGPGADPESVITPVTSKEAQSRVEAHIGAAERDGATILVDGRGQGGQAGFFLGPTIVDRVEPTMAIATEEVFGPILALERVPSLDQALAHIAASEFGNATSIYTESGRVARDFCRRVTAGMVGVNIPVPAAMAFFPFTGWKGSFYGDLHVTGMDGVMFFTESKVITRRW